MFKNENIFEFYLNNNNKKEKKENEQISEASKKVLACIIALGYESEYQELNFDIEKVIEMIMYENTNYSMLFTKEKIDDLLKELKENRSIEAQIANNCLRYERIQSSEEQNQIINQLYENFLILSETPRTSHMLYLEPNHFNKDYENVLDHIYGTLLIAIGIKSEYNYFLDYKRLFSTLLLHETDEIVIGDLPCEMQAKYTELSEESKSVISDVLIQLKKQKEYIEQIMEYKKRSDITMEYASLINRLEYLLQTKIYESKGMYIQDVFYSVYEKDKLNYYTIPCLRGILEKAKKL